MKKDTERPSLNPGKGHHESKGGVPDNINNSRLDKAIDDVYDNKACSARHQS
jgi:hypothetical protein